MWEWSISAADIFVLTVNLIHNCIILVVGHWPLVKRRKTNKERFWRVLLGKRIWSPLVESHVNAMTQMTNPFFGGWRREDKRLGGFCWWSAEEEAKENTLSDVEELLNASWNHSFTFQCRTTALRGREENTTKIQGKYEGNAKENTLSDIKCQLDFTFQVLATALRVKTQFSNVKLFSQFKVKLDFEFSYIYSISYEKRRGYTKECPELQ